MAAYRRVDDLRSPADWLPVHQDRIRAQRSAVGLKTADHHRPPQTTADHHQTNRRPPQDAENNNKCVMFCEKPKLTYLHYCIYVKRRGSMLKVKLF